MDGWGLARASSALLPRAVSAFAAGAVLAWMVATGDYRLVVAEMESGVNGVGEWSGLYDSLTRIAKP